MSKLEEPKLKISIAQINPTLGDLDGNLAKILDSYSKACEENCDLVIFPEMAICGYDCKDLLSKDYFLDEVKEKIVKICEFSRDKNCAIILGAPIQEESKHKKKSVYNSALLIEKDTIKKIIHKKTLPNSGVFDEHRYFNASKTLSFVVFRGFTLNILVCEDLWDKKNLFLALEQVFDLTIVINASPFSISKEERRFEIANKFSTTTKKPLIYCNLIGGQDELVFDGASFVMNNEGQEVIKLQRFAQDNGIFDITKSGNISAVSKLSPKESSEKLTYLACILGLRDYIYKNNFKKVLLGMSGGIDSALVASIAVDALGEENVELYALPTRYNSKSSMEDALNCAKNLNAKLQVIDIEKIFKANLETLGEISELTKQNIQSRIRGNILMSLSNNSGALLLSTGNKSELATGYATIYGDMCGAFNPIKDIYKTQIYKLANWRNNNIPEISVYKKDNLIPESIITKEPSAELKEDQKDSDSLPEYEILDKILFELVEKEKSIQEISKEGFDENIVKNIANLLYNSEYKRKQSCPGPKISDMSFNVERRYPITNRFKK